MTTTLDPKLVAERDARLVGLGRKPRWWRPLARRTWKRRRRAIMAMDCSTLTAWLRDVYPAVIVPEIAAGLGRIGRKP